MSVKFQKGVWGNSIERIPISSAVYGGEKGKRSAGRYGTWASRGVSVRRSSCACSGADNSARVFQVLPCVPSSPACRGAAQRSARVPQKQTKSFVMSHFLPSRRGSEFIAHFPANVVPFVILPKRTVTPAAIIGGINQPTSNEAGKFVG